jgi:hypothetical protein
VPDSRSYRITFFPGTPGQDLSLLISEGANKESGVQFSVYPKDFYQNGDSVVELCANADRLLRYSLQEMDGDFDKRTWENVDAPAWQVKRGALLLADRGELHLPPPWRKVG